MRNPIILCQILKSSPGVHTYMIFRPVCLDEFTNIWRQSLLKCITPSNNKIKDVLNPNKKVSIHYKAIQWCISLPILTSALFDSLLEDLQTDHLANVWRLPPLFGKTFDLCRQYPKLAIVLPIIVIDIVLSILLRCEHDMEMFCVINCFVPCFIIATELKDYSDVTHIVWCIEPYANYLIVRRILTIIFTAFFVSFLGKQRHFFLTRVFSFRWNLSSSQNGDDKNIITAFHHKTSSVPGMGNGRAPWRQVDREHPGGGSEREGYCAGAAGGAATEEVCREGAHAAHRIQAARWFGTGENTSFLVFYLLVWSFHMKFWWPNYC